jgi:signal transduction histidine kinase
VVNDLHVVAFIDLDKEIRLQEELLKINRNNDRMLAVLGHDLRAPIANLIGISDMALEHEMPQAEFTSYIKLINQQSNQVLDLLETTLNWSRMNFNNIQVHAETIQAHTCIDSILTIYKPSITAKNITVISTTATDATLFSDKEIVSMILRNLLSNAIKFTPNDGHIHIEFANNRLQISDTGIGMSSDKISSIVADNYSSTPGTNNEIGMGLGLQLVQKLAHKIKAKLIINSELNIGTTICVQFN